LSNEIITTALQRHLALIERSTGWTVVNLEISEITGAVRLEAKHEGRVMILDRDTHGRCSLTIEALREVEEFVGRRGDRFRTTLTRYDLILRIRPLGVRHGLRLMGQRMAQDGWRDLMGPIANVLDTGRGYQPSLIP
jgi:hypothetical protein